MLNSPLENEDAAMLDPKSSPVPPQSELPSGMNTGQGADDDPSLSIADKHDGEPDLDPDGDGKLTVDEANVLLGGEKGTTGESQATDNTATD